jgi:hypothetical protein
LLQSSAVTGDQLAAVQQDWAEIDFAQSGERALVMERAFIAQNTSNLRTSNSPFSSFVVFGGGGATTSGGSGEWYDEVVDLSKSAWRQARLRTKETWWKVSASYSDELLALEGEQVMIEAIRQVRTNGYFKEALDEQDKKLKALGLDDTTKFPSLWDADPADLDPRFVISQSVTTLSRFLKRMMIMESGRQMAVTAVALKRYQLRFGTYPADVSDLIPDFLPAVTRDPMDGKPLRYRLNPDGTFLLYSVGQDGTDDGGDVQPASPSKNWYWSEGRDYVWPQPASDAEIQKYRDDRAPRSR